MATRAQHRSFQRRQGWSNPIAVTGSTIVDSDTMLYRDSRLRAAKAWVEDSEQAGEYYTDWLKLDPEQGLAFYFSDTNVAFAFKMRFG